MPSCPKDQAIDKWIVAIRRLSIAADAIPLHEELGIWWEASLRLL